MPLYVKHKGIFYKWMMRKALTSLILFTRWLGDRVLAKEDDVYFIPRTEGQSNSYG